MNIFQLLPIMIKRPSFFLLILILCSTIRAAPLAQNDQDSVDGQEQWSAVPEAKESSIMEMLNSIIEMIRSQLSGWMGTSVNNDDVEIDSSNQSFMNMAHGLFSRFSNMAIDMMGQMRRIRDKSVKERLQEAPVVEKVEEVANNATTIAKRLRDQMEQTRDKIKDAWNNLVKKYNELKDSVNNNSSKIILQSSYDDQLIDNESKANENLKSDNKRVIRSLESENQSQILKPGYSYVGSTESKLFGKLVSMVDQLPKRLNGYGENRQFNSISAQQTDGDSHNGRRGNIFDRMRGAMDSARSKFFGTIGKFMNGTLMNSDDPDDESTNETEESPKNWWKILRKPKADEPTKTPDRESLGPKNLYPSGSGVIPRETINKNNVPFIPSDESTVEWIAKSIPREGSNFDKDNGDGDQSRPTIEFMDKFKEEIEKVKSSVDSNTDNLEIAVEKLANWGLFIRSITESKSLDDFWARVTQG